MYVCFWTLRKNASEHPEFCVCGTWGGGVVMVVEVLVKVAF